MYSKSYEIVKELIALQVANVFRGLKSPSIFEEAGVASSSEIEKKVYKHDGEIVNSGYKLILCLGRAAFTNDDGSINNKRFLLISAINNIQEMRDINCVHFGIIDLVNEIIKGVIIDKYESFKSLDEYTEICTDKFMSAFGISYEEIMNQCKEIAKKYESMSKIDALNYAIDRNLEFIKFANSVLPEDDKVAPVKLLSSQSVTDEERNNVKDDYSKCMNGLANNLKKSLNKEKK